MENKKCNGCKYVYVRRTRGRFPLDYQRICSRGIKNPKTGYAKRIEGANNIRCIYFEKEAL